MMQQLKAARVSEGQGAAHHKARRRARQENLGEPVRLVSAGTFHSTLQSPCCSVAGTLVPKMGRHKHIAHTWLVLFTSLLVLATAQENEYMQKSAEYIEQQYKRSGFRWMTPWQYLVGAQRRALHQTDGSP